MKICIAGREVGIRPICASDTRIESDFVRKLSAETKHRRFMCAINELTPQAARKFCEVDGDHTMAYIATIHEHGEEIEIGVSRFAPGSKADSRELAVTVADAWQNLGLESALTRPLIEFAKQHGVKRMYSIDFAYDVEMRKLANELGMHAKSDPDDTRQTIYSLAL
jgi:hypothetical protein